MSNCEFDPYLICIIAILSLLHVFNYVNKKPSIENTNFINNKDEYIDI